jgi:hypothetical protein
MQKIYATPFQPGRGQIAMNLQGRHAAILEDYRHYQQIIPKA